MRTGLPDELAGTMAGYPAGSSGAPSRHRPLVTAHQNGQHKPQGRRIWEKGMGAASFSDGRNQAPPGVRFFYPLGG